MTAAAADLLAAPPASAAISLGDVADLRRQVVRLAGRFEGDTLLPREAARVVEHVAAMRNALATVEAAAAKRVAETGHWRRAGATSAEAWLAGRSGTTVGAARDALATAERLVSLPRTAAAAKRGELSPAKADAVTAAAVVAPQHEVALLEQAATTPLGVLRDSCLAVRAAADADPEATYARQRASRSLVRGRNGEGMHTGWWRTTADDGAWIDVALEPIIDEMFQNARREGRREPRAAYAMDAMVELCRRVSGASSGTAAAPDPNDLTPANAEGLGGSGGAKPKQIPERFLALLRIDVSALQRGSVADGECCEIAGVGPVPVGVARELLGESVAKLVVTKGTDVANVTHLGRGPTAAQRIAAIWQSPICVAEGCGRRARLEFDHRTPWATVHETRLDNIDRPCDQHHDLKTYDDWELVEGTGVRPMVPPTDPRHPRYKPPPG
ncbi:MAG: DUF222 domain-containing protein [Mycobacteriales bacterium]